MPNDPVAGNAGLALPNPTAATYLPLQSTSGPSAHQTPLIPAVPRVGNIPAIPADAHPKELTSEQCEAEWKRISHYADARSKMNHDQLAHTYAAFLRWWGWAPTKEEMQRAREAAHAAFVLTGIFGPWCSPFGTQVWLKAGRDQSIAKIKELKVTDWDRADRLAGIIGVRLKQEGKPREATTASEAANQTPTAPSLIVKLRFKNKSTASEALRNAADSTHQLIESQQTPTNAADIHTQLPQAAGMDREPITEANIDANANINHVFTAARAEPPNAQPLSSTTPATGTSWMNLIERASSIGRSLLPTSSQERAPSANPGSLAQSNPPLSSDRVEDGCKTALDDMDQGDSETEDPSAQLQQEMLYASQREETRAKNVVKVEPIEEEGSTPSPDHAAREVPTSKAKTQKSAKANYNFRADMTSDPRINALIAYIVLTWRTQHKKNLSTNHEAMEKLKIHSIYALPAIQSDSSNGEMTYGLFRWEEGTITWELNSKHIDAFVDVRARQKRETEATSVNSSPPSTARPEIAAVTGSNTPKQQLDYSFTTPSKPKASPTSRPAYPDESIIAISELTPDARVNALAAHLAKKFYRAHGVNLVADGGAQNRLKMYAHDWERRLCGIREVSNLELMFWGSDDLQWKLTGHQLDILKDEWVKRFPEAEDSDKEDEDEQRDDSSSESGDDPDKDGDVDTKDDSDDSDDENGSGLKTPSDSSSTGSKKHGGHRAASQSSTISSCSSAGSKRRREEDHDNASSDSGSDDDDMPLRDLKKRRLHDKAAKRSLVPISTAPSRHTPEKSPHRELRLMSSPPKVGTPASTPPAAAKAATSGQAKSGSDTDIEYRDIDQELMEFAEHFAEEE